MLGFATLDLSIQDNTLTIWLTSVQGATHTGHTNAVTFDLGDDTTPRRALSMICDRYVVLTNRTPRAHPLLIGWGVEPCELSTLAKQTTDAQATIMAAFEKYRTTPGKANLVEPGLAPVPAPFDQATIRGRSASAVHLGSREPGDADVDGLADH